MENHNGSIQTLPKIPTIYKELYKIIWEIKQVWVLKVQLKILKKNIIALWAYTPLRGIALWAYTPLRGNKNYFIYAYNKDYYKNKEYIKISNKHRKPKIYKD